MNTRSWDEFVARAGGLEGVRAYARRIGATPQVIYGWKTRGAPARHVLALSQGAQNRHEPRSSMPQEQLAGAISALISVHHHSPEVAACVVDLLATLARTLAPKESAILPAVGVADHPPARSCRRPASANASVSPMTCPI